MLINFHIGEEIRKFKILSLPKYDEKTDSFIQQNIPLEKAFN